MPEENEAPKQVSFPITNFTVATNGILCETHYSPTVSTRLVIPEDQVNQLFKAWLASRQQLQKQQQLITDVMRSKLH